jgi:hypothetical protein
MAVIGGVAVTVEALRELSKAPYPRVRGVFTCAS